MPVHNGPVRKPVINLVQIIFPYSNQGRSGCREDIIALSDLQSALLIVKRQADRLRPYAEFRLDDNKSNEARGPDAISLRTGFAEQRELQLMVASGLTPLRALGCATGRAAALLGLTDRGVLAPGKLADFVILTANPLDDIANTEKFVAVWHRGKQASGPIGSFTQ